jgi:tripartite-type tricarboxylate transporter receptor subunit TctC
VNVRFFNFTRDIAPVAGIMRSPNVMAVNPSLPARTVPEFIAYANANPGKVNMGSAGIGSVTHICGELFKILRIVDAVQTALAVQTRAATARRARHGDIPSGQQNPKALATYHEAEAAKW